MQSKKSDSPVTHTEFVKETGTIRAELHKETETIRTEFRKEFESVRKEMATMATKDGLNKLAIEIVKTQSDLKEVKETMATKMATKDDISKVLGAIDAFAQKAENYDRKALFHDSRINNHEERITQLEKSASS